MMGKVIRMIRMDGNYFCVGIHYNMSSSQYSASTLDVNASYMGEHIPCVISNVAWSANHAFTGTVDGISVSGTDNNGDISATGYYYGCKYTASGVVSGWD